MTTANDYTRMLPDSMGVPPRKMGRDRLDFLVGGMNNAKVVSKFLNDNEAALTLDDYRAMLVLEVGRGGGPRYDVVRRIVGRFNVVRNLQEWKTLVARYF